LGLDLKGVPQKVVHLTAANEYRKNFSLADITSLVEAGAGMHSNLGVNYGEVTDKEHWLLIEQGWCRPKEITRTPYLVHEQYLYTA
jgi:hypothetical protein